MSAPSRGAGASRGRSTTPPTGRGRGTRGASRPFQPRGRGRGAPVATTNPRAEGLLQGLQAGTTARRGQGSENGATRGARGRGSSTRGTSIASRGQFTNTSRTFKAPKLASTAPKTPTAPISSADFMTQATARFETLKRNREAERVKAIKEGFLADPDRKTTLDNAITPVGTCTEMCPGFERVERIVQRMVDKSEKVREDITKPDEERMVKRFRRSAAGYDEQLPSDIRTPVTLKMTLDYLMDEIIGGGERLASIHKFVWDRTRGIRNDFSIQQVTKKEDVRLAVECLERIARFHILSLHQLSNPENLVGEQFDAHQDREQLNNTLLSLIYYYDDNRHVLDFPNEAEFRAYCIIFELQSQHPDLEDRMHSWPKALLEDGRVKTAFKLYAAAGNNLFDQGPLRPMTTFSLAQGNTGSFWSILSSKQVSYLMACVAEIYFGQVRYMALQALWTAATSAPVMTRAKNQDWTLEELANVLGFDAEEQAAEFCEEFGLKISTKDDGVPYLDVSLNQTLDKSSIPTKQVFSYGIVEAKRFRRTLTAVINGKTVPQAVREGLVEFNESQQESTEEEDPPDDGESLFLPEKKPVSANPFAIPAEQASANPFAKPAMPGFNPRAPTFAPGIFQQPASKAESSANPFASFEPASLFASEPPQASSNPFAKFASAFPTTGQSRTESPTTAAQIVNPFSTSNGSGSLFTTRSTQSTPQPQPVVVGDGGFTATTAAASVNIALPTTKPFAFTDFDSQSTSISTTPSQPPTFSWPNSQENTQSTGDLDVAPDFHPAVAYAFEGPTTATPGTVSSQQHLQPTWPPLKKPQQPLPAPGPPTPSQYLKNARSVGPVKFSLAPNGPLAAFEQPARTWPRQFPQQSTPQIATPRQNLPPSPLSRPGEAQNPIVLDSIETDTTNTQNIAPPGAQSNQLAKQFTSLPQPPGCNTQSNAQPSEQLSPTPRSGYQWSDPTVPGYRSTTSPRATALKSQKPPRTAADRQRIVDALAHVAMTQQNGNLMDEYTKFTVPRIIDEAIAQYNREVHKENSDIIKQEYLLKKYVKRMEEAYWSRKLKGLREKRREGFSEIERLSILEERRSQSSADVEDIITAMQESATVQAKIKANLEREQKEKWENERRKKGAAANAAKASQIAGRKRKSDASEQNSETRLDLAGRPYTPRHKRSKTETHIDSDQDSDDAYERHQVRYTATPQHSVGRSLFSRTLSAYGTRLASELPLRRSIDNTKTDYFRLKALGIDPETPLVPLTFRQVEHRLEKAEAEKARRAAEPKPWQGNSTLRRLSNGLPAWGMPKLTDFEMPPPAKPLPSPVLVPEKPKTTTSSIEELLDKLKRARQEQEADTDWFKAQRRELEQQVDLAEQSIQVHQTIEHRNSSQTDSSGLVRSQLGYEFVPAQSKPGHTLSRTEQRIRHTGAHGLATAPIGGTPGYVKPEFSYSERTLRASLHGTSNGEQDVAGTNCSQDVVDVFSLGLIASDPPYVAPHEAKKIPNSKGKERAVDDESTNASHAANGHEPFQHSMSSVNGLPAANPRNGLDLEEAENFYQQRRASEDVLQEDEEFSGGDNYAAEHEEEEEELDEDDMSHHEEDYDDEDESEDEEQAGPSHRDHYLSTTPDAGGFPSRAASSGAHSGAGASVDDAIDLLDSD